MKATSIFSAAASGAGERFPAFPYQLAVPRDERAALAAGWLLLALASLIGSGIFSILLVLSRTPYIQGIFPLADFFHVALVVHVDLSVLVWFLAFAGILWSLTGTQRWLPLAYFALVFCAIGTAMLVIAPFFGRGTPIMANYVPVLDDPLFLSGLLVFCMGFALLVMRSLGAAPGVGVRPAPDAALAFGLNAAAVSAAVALIALAWSYLAMPGELIGKPYYEILFWGSGHVIQFTYTLLMLVAWLWLAGAVGAPLLLTPRIVILLFMVGLVSVFATPVIYLAYDISSVEHRRLLTWLMQFGGGLAILPFTAAVALGLLRAKKSAEAAPERAALVTSILLFGAGGFIGFMIQGANVKIPAHYHGCIVGVTLAMMGLAYHLLPKLGLGTPNRRLATAQPWIYGAGQLMHIGGLVWSGGYGVQRKVAGAEQVLRTTGEIAGMGMMGLGGLIAVIGGLLFVLVVGQAMWRSSRDRRHALGA
jgi:hypothetical protein